MTTSQIINQTLWNEFREAIDKAYREHGKSAAHFEDDFACLMDYSQDISMHDALVDLMERETANERQHRHNRPSVPGFSCSTAAKLILMSNAAKGARMPKMPKASAFLVLRQTAVEAEVIGWIIREYLDPNWITAVESIDYAKLMQAA